MVCTLEFFVVCDSALRQRYQPVWADIKESLPCVTTISPNAPAGTKSTLIRHSDLQASEMTQQTFQTVSLIKFTSVMRIRSTYSCLPRSVNTLGFFLSKSLQNVTSEGSCRVVDSPATHFEFLACPPFIAYCIPLVVPVKPLPPIRLAQSFRSDIRCFDRVRCSLCCAQSCCSERPNLLLTR
jgi:hypothetical protein